MQPNIRILLVLLFFSSLANSQDLMRIFNDTVNEDPFLKISSFDYYSSNRFDNEFMDKFIFGGDIDQLLKDRQSSRLKGLNSIGSEAEQRIDSYTPTIHPLKKERYGLLLSFSDNHFFSGNVSQGLFNLTMYGNANYVGDTMDLSFVHAQYQHYQKFSIGFYDKRSLSSVQLSYVAGSRGFDFRSADSRFVTQSTQDTVELRLRGEGFSTASFSPYWAFQGSGFAVDINYNFIFYAKTSGNRQIVSLKINNLGAIFWNKNSQNYFVDSTTYYTGFNVNELLGKDSLTNQYNFKDTLGIVKTAGRYGEALPLELTLDKLADRGIDQKWQWIGGFKAILTQDFYPYFYAGAYYQPSANFSVSTHVSYGGFARLRLGLNLNYWLDNRMNIALGTMDVIGNISKKYGFGRGLNFSATFKL